MASRGVRVVPWWSQNPGCYVMVISGTAILEQRSLEKQHATECQFFSGLQATTDKPYPIRRQVPPTAYPASKSLLGRLETLTKAGAHLYTPLRAPSIGAVQ